MLRFFYSLSYLGDYNIYISKNYAFARNVDFSCLPVSKQRVPLIQELNVFDLSANNY